MCIPAVNNGRMHVVIKSKYMRMRINEEKGSFE